MTQISCSKINLLYQNRQQCLLVASVRTELLFLVIVYHCCCMLLLKSCYPVAGVSRPESAQCDGAAAVNCVI